MKKALLAAIAAVFLCSPSFSQTIVRVDRDAPGAVQDGLTWGTAYTELHTALDLTQNPASEFEFWVAEGIYKPNPGNEQFSLDVREGVSIYGAFLGFDSLGLGVGEESSVATREGRASRTILSGDRLSLGSADPSGHLHVITARSSGFAPNNDNPRLSVIDGFRIQHGYADTVFPNLFGDVGGGLRIGRLESYHRVALRNLQVVDNVAVTSGGGIYTNSVLDLEVVNCTFERNVVLAEDTPGIQNPLGFGGAIFIETLSSGSTEDSLAIYNCQFKNNSAPRGSALALFRYANNFFQPPTGPAMAYIGNCIFADNRATEDGGAFHFANQNGKQGSMSFYHNTVVDNAGGGIFLEDPTPGSTDPMNITSCIVTGNTMAAGIRDLSGNAALNASVAFSLIGTSGAAWPGFGNIAANPMFINPAAGNYRLLLSSPAIDAGSDAPLAPFTTLIGISIGDLVDLDGDGIDIGEALPFDFEPGQPREEDVLTVPDTGQNASGTQPAISDMGAFEREAN